MAPLVIFFLLAVVDFGIAVNRRVVLDHAAREGARFAAVGGHAFSSGTPATSAEIIAYTMAQGQNVPQSVTVCYVNANGNGTVGDIGDSVRVTVNYTYDFVTGFTSLIDSDLGSIAMNPSAEARVERAIQNPQACA
jgi:Flp pilus assembly protein TadG